MLEFSFVNVFESGNMSIIFSTERICQLAYYFKVFYHRSDRRLPHCNVRRSLCVACWKASGTCMQGAVFNIVLSPKLKFEEKDFVD